jgi:predicted Ser/Thr protein kinase
MASFNMVKAKEAREIAESVDVVELLLKNIEYGILQKSKQGCKSMTDSLSSNGSNGKVRNKAISQLKKNGYSVEKSDIVLGWYIISW